MRIPRDYADTSVFGGVFDVEFATASQRFFDQVRAGRFHLVISALVEEGLAAAPPQVQELYDEMLAMAEVVGITEDATELRQAYLDAGIVTPRAFADALHVALASAAGCSLIVIWNFRHIVNFRRTRCTMQSTPCAATGRLPSTRHWR